ncbi:homeobox protein Mohawk-like [Syngnathoides biaculeatus]|uniref:homeobox protein Mohawk-like n=1 Tax=Syngnathoides biaculeatus TaxID=300417 RepID=UPI002ADE32CA|nr:homeobox protein Mohawk-like [Syngnathoides biaculeatus]
MASDGLLASEDQQRGRPNGGFVSAHAAQLLRYGRTAEGSSSVKYRSYGSRLGGVKVRHKRQVLQDMARPLKRWLYKHRDNPYPTKTEKVLLALGSHMTLVQVSNWFANARRRLKNTVRQPDLSWALRIKLYNKYIQGNAERLSVCSDDTDSDDDERRLETAIRPSDAGRSSTRTCGTENRAGVLNMADGGASPPSKYKSSLLNRYLNDTLRHMMAAGEADGVAVKRRSRSESFSSNECDRDAVSPTSSCGADANFIYQMETLDYASSKCDSVQPRERGQRGENRQDWREINAAVALTSLAHGQNRRSDRTPLGTAAGLSRRREPLSVTGTNIPRRTPVAAPAPASRVIQKSSHISEVQTIKVGTV